MSTYNPGAPAMAQAGCVLAIAGVFSFAVAMLGLRHALVEFGGYLPVLPGLLAGLTHFVRAAIRLAAINTNIGGAVVLTALGMYLLYRSEHDSA